MSMNIRRNLPRVLIADDHILVAEACRKLLESEYDVVATVSDGRALVRAAAELKPHLIIVDVAMPILNGLDAGQQVKEFLPAVKLVYLTMNHDADLAAAKTRLRDSRELELRVLTMPQARDFLAKQGVQLISYRELPKTS